MKLRIVNVVLLLLLGLWVSPALAQGAKSNAVTFNGFSFTFPSSVAENVDISIYPGDPADAQQPGGPEVKHTEFILYNGRPAPESGFDAAGAIRVYRVADFAAYDIPKQQLEQLKKLIDDQPDLAPYMAINLNGNENNLPFMPVMPAAQAIRARADYVETDAVKGVVYITVYRQDVSPFTSGDFFYTFQGISADGDYYVSAIFRPTTRLFPAEITNSDASNMTAEKYQKYMDESLAKLNKATANDFKPTLSTFDAIIQSFAFTSR